ncbi:MAG: glycosyltransferase family 4 protein [Thermoanaerobaculales bacterium]
MRLLVAGPGHPYRGGIARCTTALAAGLEGRGHEVLFLTPRRQYPEWLYPGRDDRDPTSSRRLECARAVLDPMNPFAWPAGRREAVEFGADAWIFPFWTWAWAGWLRFLLRGSRRPPAVAVVHNLVDHDADLRQRVAARIVLGRCQAFFTHAEAMSSSLASVHPGVPSAVFPHPRFDYGELPPKAEARAALDLPRDGRVALFMGLIRPYKGVDVLVDAAARLPSGNDWTVVVAGEPWGSLGSLLEAQVRKLGLEERVRLRLDWVAEEEVPQLLAAADIMVLPFRAGSQSGVAATALGYGLPVLSTAIGGVPEVVRHGVNGLVVQPGSAEELAEALSSLDRALLDKLAAGARATGKTLDWADYVEVMEGLLVRVVG